MTDTGNPPANPPAGDPKPPEGDPKPPEEGDKPPTKDEYNELKAAINEERKARKAAEDKLSKVEKDHMTEQEKAIREARDAGRQEAVIAAGRRLAAEMFKAQAAGKIADPAAALELFDLSKFVREDGEPDTSAIAKVVERLTPAMAPPNTGRVPAGPRSDNEDGGDFIRQAMQRR